MDRNAITRREGLGLAAMLAGAAASPPLAAKPKIDFVSKVDFKTRNGTATRLREWMPISIRQRKSWAG